MRVFRASLVAIALFVGTLPVAGQTPFPSQGGALVGAGASGAATRPGLPPRDPSMPNAAAVPTKGTAVMRGRVLSATGTPLRRAQVALSPETLTAATAQLRRSVSTDADGAWELADLPAGRYLVSVSKGGYVNMAYGQRRPFEPGKPIPLTDGQKAEHLDITLQRGGVIAGRIHDEFGEPVASIAVQAMRYSYSDDGQRRLTSVGNAATDDLGQFRVFGLMPGDYVVSAAAGGLVLTAAGISPGADSFAPTYYPGTPVSDEAQMVTLGLGQEADVQFQLVPARTTRVTGVVVSSEGRPLAGMSLMLMTVTAGNSNGIGSGSTAADGTFTITNVAPGEHAISVRPSRNIEGAEAAMYSFTAGGEPLDVHITTSRGATLTGRITWEGAASHGATPARVSVQRPAYMALMTGGALQDADGTVADDNTFRLAGFTGKFPLTVNPVPAGWALKSITASGRDITDVPIDLTAAATIDDIAIVLTDKQTDLSGQVSDARGMALKDYQVVVLPVGLREGVSPQRYVKMARPDQSGRFSVKGLPPGRYTATAVEWIEQGRQNEPGFQEQLRKAGTSLTLSEGQTKTIDLKLVDGL
jgi:hypothetical protein